MKQIVYVVTDVQKDMEELASHVEALGYLCEKFPSSEDCIAALTDTDLELPCVILADADISGLDGFELLRICQMSNLHIPVVVCTGTDTLESANKALQFGAWDYVIKPVQRQRLAASLENLDERQRLQRQVEILHKKLKGDISFEDLVCESHAMKRLVEMLRRACESDVTALLQGEEGVGKHYFARLIHRYSQRRDGPCEVLNCSAVSPSVIDIELFGQGERPGKLLQATGGTLLLDEVADLDPQNQEKLVRTLQEGKIYPEGSEKPVPINTRIIASTKRNLRQLVQEGLFREDLFYRLNILPMEVPPLRERRRDISGLLNRFMKEFCLQNGLAEKSFTAAAEKELIEFHWPGNVSQMENVIQRLATMLDGDLIEKQQLDFLTTETGSPIHHEQVSLLEMSPALSLHEVEQTHIRRVVRHCNHNMSQAARVLGVSRSTLYRHLENMGLND